VNKCQYSKLDAGNLNDSHIRRVNELLESTDKKVLREKSVSRSNNINFYSKGRNRFSKSMFPNKG